MKKKLLFILQMEIGLGIITYFFVKMYADGELVKFANALSNGARNPGLLIAGMSLFLACLTICSKRWQILLEAQGIHVRFSRIIELYFIGHFFNSLLPGATSGDILKAVYLARETPDKKTEAITTIAADRLIGLVALVALTVVIMVIQLQFFLKYQETKLALIIFLALLAGIVAGAAVVFGRNLFEKWSFFRRIEERTALGVILKKIYSALHSCIKSPAVLAKATILSLLNHVIFILSSFLIGRALEIPLNFGAYMTVFPIINAIAALPLTPGGIGTRDMAAVFLLGVMNVARPTAISLSLLLYLTPVLWSLVGGIVYFFYLIRSGSAPAQIAPDAGTET
jgi:uncharacterized protein (TIRG00374 family)